MSKAVLFFADGTEECDPMYDLISKNIIENQSLAKARDIMLPKLMNGELDVSDL